MSAVRTASAAEAGDCARILKDWITRTDWMPDLHVLGDIERHYRERVFARCEVFAIGVPMEGFAARDADDWITALYVARPGMGLGAALMRRLKRDRVRLRLWTFAANTGAQRFYRREGFRCVGGTDGENDEGIADLQFQWSA